MDWNAHSQFMALVVILLLMLLNECIPLNFIKYNLSIVLPIIMSKSVCLLRRFLICQNYSILYTFLSKCFKILAFLFWSMSCFK